MDFVNETKFEAGWTLGFEPDGRELLVVAVKATFSIPASDENAVLAEKQVTLTTSDEFTGEPGLSALIHESDYAHRKPHCDVLLNGSAYAPEGKPVTSVIVGMQVGSMRKSFRVIGDRIWFKDMLSMSISLPRKFIRVPITYDCAYGGVDVDKNKSENVKTFLDNPVGVGYYPLSKDKDLEGKLLPNTEEIDRTVNKTEWNYKPMSFGPIGRNFATRVAFSGTYNEDWLNNRAPFWPDDFDYCYFQSAPTDQQIRYPKGGELLVLKNLSPGGYLSFRLPQMDMPILLVPYHGSDFQLNANIDTVLIEPDSNHFALTWRVSLPLKRNCFELKRVIVGVKQATWRRANRVKGKKKYYKGLSEFIKAKKGQEEF